MRVWSEVVVGGPELGARRTTQFGRLSYRGLRSLKEAYTMSRYGEASYSKEGAKSLVELTSRLVELLEEVAIAVKSVELG